MKCNLMIVSKGALTFTDLENIPIPRIFDLNKQFEKINEQIKREVERSSKR